MRRSEGEEIARVCERGGGSGGGEEEEEEEEGEGAHPPKWILLSAKCGKRSVKSPIEQGVGWLRINP